MDGPRELKAGSVCVAILWNCPVKEAIDSKWTFLIDSLALLVVGHGTATIIIVLEQRTDE